MELISSLEKVLGHELPLEHLEPRSGDVRDSLADLTQLRQLFPRLQPTALDEGLRTTVSWFEDMRIHAA
jgi:UDP-glucose 4-epimerase